MPDNLPSDFIGYSPLSGHPLLSLSGADAVAFAHAQFSSDVTALPLRQWQWSAWLTAKGRTIAVFQLLKLAEDQILLVMPDADADAIASQLQRFVFRRKVRVEVRNDLSVTARFAAPEAASGAAIAQFGADGIELDMGSDALPRSLRIGAAADATAANGEDINLAWRQSDLRYGVPRLDAAQREQWTPQQLGLDRLNGYSVKKGCYPGQEIVARTHFLGKAKRALQLLRVADGTASGTQVLQNEAAIGTVASVAGEFALAVLPLEIAAEPLAVASVTATPLPLLDGLAR